MSYLGATQCVPIEASNSYLLLAQLYIRSGQMPPRAGGVAVQYFDQAGCTSSGTSNLGEHSFLELGTDAWRTVQRNLAAPDRVKSMLVRLFAESEPGAPALEVKFDNILVRAL